MKLVATFGLLLVNCLFQTAYTKVDKGSLLARIENIQGEAQASINDLRSFKRDFLIDLKYLLSNVKSDELQRIDRTIKQTLYRIKRATKTGNVIECYQSYVSSIENSKLPARKILNKCWQTNMESVYGPIYEADEIELRPTKSSGNAEKCYDEAESSIERLFSSTRLDLTKCSHESLESALNLTSRAENLAQGTGNMVIDSLNSIQQECQTTNNEETETCILHRIHNDIDSHAKRLKQLTKNLLDERKPIESQAIVDAKSCSERPVADMYKNMSEIEKKANACIRNL